MQVLVLLLLGLAACEAQTATGSSSKPSDQLPPLIPLKLLLGNSKYRNAQLSPDGKYLAYVRPSGPNDVYNVFIKALPGPGQVTAAGASSSLFEKEGVAKDKQVTFDKERGVTSFSWAEDGSAIYFIQDTNGDENDHLYMVPLSSLKPNGQAVKPIDLTPFKGVKASTIIGSKRFPNKLYIGLNRRDPSVFDMYALDVPTRTLTLDTVNPGDVSSWIFDYDFKIKGAMGYNNSDGGAYVLIKDTPAAATLSSNSNSSSSSSSKPAAITTEASPSKTNNISSSSFADLEALFKAAKKGNWTTSQWIAASSSRSDVAQWRKLLEWPFGEDGGVFRFNKAGDALYVVSSIGRDTTEFQLVGTGPGAPIKQRISSNPLVNVNSVLFHPDEWYPQMISYNYLRNNWTVLDPKMQEDWDRLVKFRPGESMSISDISNDRKTWVVLYSSDNSTSRYFLYHKGTWPPQLLFEVQPALKPYKLSKMHPVIITARDGLRLPSYLSLPVLPGVPAKLPASVTGEVPTVKNSIFAAANMSAATTNPDRSIHWAPKPASAAAAALAEAGGSKPLNLNLPMVLYVHGGPWSRDYWGADSVVQWLNNRGYAVLQVNYRGSTGFGKAFMNAGNKQWGVGYMQHDLSDAVAWAVAKGIADPNKVCIMGGSYGGYATLAGLTFTPELYSCGVDLVGISNVGTFMRSIPPYWKPLRYEWATRVGDAEKNETLNREISPYYHVDKIRAPLLIGQGANDPRVPQPESDQMFSAMKAKGLDVQYVLYPDEGHGLVRAANRLDFYSRADQFFSKHLGGRKEPFVARPQSTAKVITEVKPPTAAAAAAGKPAAQGSEGGAGAAVAATVKAGSTGNSTTSSRSG
ncbi:hypothetical protein OEZ86_012612 [Tetradesmus obliquus]|nr:hypothetical protein OEZ86_012612 [Tetradesmus obliquus]